MGDNRRRWLDVGTAAAELGLPIDVVKEAIYKGELPALLIGGHIRINLDASLEKAASRLLDDGFGQPQPSNVEDELTGDSGAGIPAPVGVNWVSDLAPSEDYTYFWPQKREDYGKDSSEKYTKVQDGTVRLLGELFDVKVGRATRYGRGRLTAFFKNIDICEFMETGDGEHWASLVKPDGKKVLRPWQTPPPLYQHARLEPYREATDYKKWSTGSGIGIPKGMAVVIPKDDYRSAVHHAAARWLGKRGHIVEGAGV